VTARVTWVIRRARTAARSRGIPFDRLLPVAVIGAGALLGLVAGAAAWSAAKAALLDYRVNQQLEVSAGPGRDAEAAELLVAEVSAAEFQRQWTESDAPAAGLRGPGRLWAAATAYDEAAARRCAVLLCCQGRPGPAAAEALAAARRRLIDRAARLELMPPGHAEDRRRLLEERAGREEQIEKLRERQARLRPDPARQAEADRLAAAAEEARRALRAEEEKLARLAPREAELRAARAALQDRLREVADLPPPDATENARLRAERTGLESHLAGASPEDCTEEHPIRKRLAEVDRLLRRAEFPGKIADADRELAAIGAERASLEKARAEEKARRDERDAAQKALGALGRDSEDLAPKLAAAQRELAELAEKLAALDARGRTRIAVHPGGQALTRPPGGLGLILLLFTAAGAGLGLLFQVRVMPGFSLIDDEAGLADRLRAPVLGKVPRLAALERR
jgi:hypothetical protein